MLDQTYSKQLHDHANGVTSMTMRTGHRLRIIITVGSASANGTEAATGGGYTSGTGAPTFTWGAGTTASPSVASNSTAVTITNYPRAETVNGVEVWDSVPARERLANLTTPRVMASGDTLSFATGALVSNFGG